MKENRTISPLSQFFENKIPEESKDNLKTLYLKNGFYETWMENYFESYIQRDIPSLFPKLDLIKYQRFISMLTSLSGSLINKANLVWSINSSEVTVRGYLSMAYGSFILRNIPNFEKAKTKLIVKMLRATFRDSGSSHFI